MNNAHNPRTFSSTPNLAAQKAQVQRSAAAKKYQVILTADEVRKLRPDNPLRIAYQAGGDPGVRAYLQQQKAA